MRSSCKTLAPFHLRFGLFDIGCMHIVIYHYVPLERLGKKNEFNTLRNPHANSAEAMIKKLRLQSMEPE